MNFSRQEINNLNMLSSSLNLKKKKQDLIFLSIELFTLGCKCNFIKKENDGYSFSKDDYKYSLSRLSDKKYISSLDRDSLCDCDYRKKVSIYGNLRIINSCKLPNSSLLVGSNNQEALTTLIRYEKKNKTFIIDYDHNLVMPESDYIKFFDLSVLKELTTEEVERLFLITDQYNFELPALFLLEFNDYIVKDLEKNSKVLLK